MPRNASDTRRDPRPDRAVDALTVKRLPDPEGRFAGARYAVTTEDGVEYTVAKEFYADGPSMFTWTVTGGPGEGVWAEFGTKKQALAYIASLPADS